MKTNVNAMFLNQAHEERFNQLVAIRKIFANDINYTSAGYLLSANEEIFIKSVPYVSVDGIDFDGLLNNVDLTSGQKPIVIFASDLFRGGGLEQPLSLSDLAYCDSEMVIATCNAILLYTDIEGKKVGEAFLASMSFMPKGEKSC